LLGILVGGSEKSVGGLAVAVGGLGKLASVFTVGGLCVRWLPHDLLSGRVTVGVARPWRATALRAATRRGGGTASVQRFARMAAVAESLWLRTSRDPRQPPPRKHSCNVARAAALKRGRNCRYHNDQREIHSQPRLGWSRVTRAKRSW